MKNSGGILHVHPSLRCNLTCGHCYSSSSPHLKDGISVDDIFDLMKYVRHLGYDVLSVSGGEPFLYPDLDKLLQAAKENGMRTQLVTNGILVSSSFARRCLPFLDLVAVSIDGDESLHDKVRNQKGAYQKALKGIGFLRESNMPIGIVSAVTNESWCKMIDIAEMAYRNGASLVQFHPLEVSGRAALNNGFALGESELYKAFILSDYLKKKYREKMFVQIDCIHRNTITEFPELVGYYPEGININAANMLLFSNSIIVNEKGDILPFSYGLNGKYAIGNIKRVKSDYSVMFEKYFQNDAQEYLRLIRNGYEKYIGSGTVDLVVWSDYVVKTSNVPIQG